MREIFADPVRRAITLLGWVSALFLVAPEAVALAYRPGLSGAIGGVLLAAVPAGSAIGALLMPRLQLRDQLRLLLPAGGAVLPAAVRHVGRTRHRRWPARCGSSPGCCRRTC